MPIVPESPLPKLEEPRERVPTLCNDDGSPAKIVEGQEPVEPQVFSFSSQDRTSAVLEKSEEKEKEKEKENEKKKDDGQGPSQETVATRGRSGTYDLALDKPAYPALPSEPASSGNVVAAVPKTLTNFKQSSGYLEVHELESGASKNQEQATGTVATVKEPASTGELSPEQQQKEQERKKRAEQRKQEREAGNSKARERMEREKVLVRVPLCVCFVCSWGPCQVSVA